MSLGFTKCPKRQLHPYLGTADLDPTQCPQLQWTATEGAPSHSLCKQWSGAFLSHLFPPVSVVLVYPTSPMSSETLQTVRLCVSSSCWNCCWPSSSSQRTVPGSDEGCRADGDIPPLILFRGFSTLPHPSFMSLALCPGDGPASWATEKLSAGFSQRVGEQGSDLRKKGTSRLAFLPMQLSWNHDISQLIS